MAVMRRVSGSLVVAALAALALAAALDALRLAERAAAPPPREERASRVGDAPPELPGRAEAAARLRAEGVSGALIFIDERCRYWGLELPELEWRWDAARPARVCTFSFTFPRREAFAASGRLWTPEGRLVGACRHNLVDVYANERDSFYRLRGCTPAWRPDGRVTYVRADEVLEVEPSCRPGARRVMMGERRRCARPVLSRADLERAVRAAGSRSCPPAPADVCGGLSLRALAVRDVAWLTPTRLVAHVRFASPGGSRRELVAVFERRRLVAPPVAARRFDDLRVSARRRYFSVRGGRPAALFFFDRRARLLAHDPVPGGHHVAWSPDERWTAVATGAGTYVFASDAIERYAKERRLAPIRLPFHAADLAWQ